MFIIIILIRIHIMTNFLFHPTSIDGVHYKPIKIDIHQGVIKIDDEFLRFPIKHYRIYYSWNMIEKRF